MIEAKNLTKNYGRTRALDGVSFSVEKGEIVGLLGPNAAGKTTMMRILTCFLPPTSGTAAVNGHDVREDPLAVQRSIGYLPERTPLYEEFTVAEFLSFAAEAKDIRKKRERVRRVADVMAECGLADVQNKTIAKLSKGYRQRVGIAQALIADPACLILDEPTIGLDPRQIIEARNLIKNLAGRRTVILSTHILPEVSMTCRRVVIINEGRIVATDTVENLTTRMKGAMEIELEVEGDREKVVRALGEIPGVDRVETLPAGDGKGGRYLVRSARETDLRRDISAKIVGQGFTLYGMSLREMTLEDIFLKLVTKEQS